MDPKRNFMSPGLRNLLVLLCAIVLVPGDTMSYAPSPQTAGQASQIPPDQLDSLVAPIALYPDPLLAQVLAASTYPLEIIQLQQWLTRNAALKDKALADAVQKEPEHRGGAPYRDRSTADRFGGAARGDSLANRQANAREQIGRQAGQSPSNNRVGDRARGAGVGNPAGAGAGAGVGNRAGAGAGA